MQHIKCDDLSKLVKDFQNINFSTGNLCRGLSLSRKKFMQKDELRIKLILYLSTNLITQAGAQNQEKIDYKKYVGPRRTI